MKTLLLAVLFLPAVISCRSAQAQSEGCDEVFFGQCPVVGGSCSKSQPAAYADESGYYFVTRATITCCGEKVPNQVVSISAPCNEADLRKPETVIQLAQMSGEMPVVVVNCRGNLDRFQIKVAGNGVWNPESSPLFKPTPVVR